MSHVQPVASSDLRRSTIAASERAQQIVGRNALRKLMVRTDRPGLLFLASHLGLIGLSGTWVFFALGTWWIVPATFAHGVFIVHLFAPLHECSHSTAFKSRWLNQTVYWFCALTLGLAPLHFKLQHADHHTYTQNIERDPQMIILGERLWGYLYYASAIPYFRDIVSVLVRHALGRFSERELTYVYPKARKQVQRQAWVMLSAYGLIAAVSVVTQSWAALTFWLIPRIIAEPVERLIRLAEHGGCDHTDDMLQNTRTILTWRPVRWLSWNMPLHTAHHAAPQVPFHAMLDLNRILISHMKELRHGYPATVRHQVSALIAKEKRLRTREV